MTRSRLRPSLRGTAPGTKVERAAWAAGLGVVVGIDEVGRGAWAGPLTVAALAVPEGRRITRVRDSKALTAAEREALFEPLTAWALGWGVGHVSPNECDQLGMSAAQRLGARRALESMGLMADLILVDGTWDFVGDAAGNAEVRTIVHGDAASLAIAAASVVAKVTRDQIMRDEAENFPAFNFERNKGYPCAQHRASLSGRGPTTIHRRSWSFMDGLPWTGQPRIHPGGSQGVLFA